MSSPYIGEIRMAGFNFAPEGWALCDGALQSISENPALFQLIGTTYGGDGQSTFALPDLQAVCRFIWGRDPASVSESLAETGGTEAVTVITQQLPVHNHLALAQPAASNQQGPGGNVWATSTLNLYGTTTPPDAAMNGSSLSPSGGSQPHDNMLPFLCVNFIISLFGIFPSQG